MPETKSAIFYRRQAERLTSLAAETNSPATRLELLEIASRFQRLAEYAAANSDLVEEEAVNAPA